MSDGPEGVLLTPRFCKQMVTPCLNIEAAIEQDDHADCKCVNLSADIH
jgi:hypothetical protein